MPIFLAASFIVMAIITIRHRFIEMRSMPAPIRQASLASSQQKLPASSSRIEYHDDAPGGTSEENASLLRFASFCAYAGFGRRMRRCCQPAILLIAAKRCRSRMMPPRYTYDISP